MDAKRAKRADASGHVSRRNGTCGARTAFLPSVSPARKSPLCMIKPSALRGRFIFARDRSRKRHNEESYAILSARDLISHVAISATMHFIPCKFSYIADGDIENLKMKRVIFVEACSLAARYRHVAISAGSKFTRLPLRIYNLGNIVLPRGSYFTYFEVRVYRIMFYK